MSTPVMSSPGSSARRPSAPQPRSSTRAPGARRGEEARRAGAARARAASGAGEAGERAARGGVDVGHAAASIAARPGSCLRPATVGRGVRPRHDPRRGPRCLGALLPDRARRRSRSSPTARASASCAGSEFMVAAPSAERPPTRGPARGLRRALARARRRVLARGRPRRATRTTARPASARSTRPTTTARSCAIPTATASRPSTTATRAAAGTSTTCGSACAIWRPPRPSTTTIARHTGLRPGRRWEQGVQFRGAWATFSLVADGRPPTREPPHRVPGPATARRSRSSTPRPSAAGYESNGEPGERPQYRPGYYAAFALDPDGTNVESVLDGARGGLSAGSAAAGRPTTIRSWPQNARSSSARCRSAAARPSPCRR